jgi:hypothetical protein
MPKNKTAETEYSVIDFIQEFVDSEQKRKDSKELINLMKEVTGHDPVMWGTSIIGFGKYHYKYKSGHEGDAPLLGFSPRKSAISLYVSTGRDDQLHLINKLGSFKMGKVCIYLKKLSDIDQSVLIELMRDTISFMENMYENRIC